MTTTSPVMDAGPQPGIHHLIETTRKLLYASQFPVGERGGAVIDFGRAVRIECLVPYTDDSTGETFPFIPLPLDGRTIIHDIGRKKEIDPWELEACQNGSCSCDSRPSGWILPRPVIRAMLNVTDAWLNDHARELPGLIGASWEVLYDTMTFMAECYFNSEFLLPTRAASRTARANRMVARTLAKCAHPHRQPPHRRR